MTILMLRLVLLILVPEALFAFVLFYTILVGHINKIFGIITRTIKILHGLYCMVFKICAFGLTLSPILCQVFMESKTKASASLILSRVGST